MTFSITPAYLNRYLINKTFDKGILTLWFSNNQQLTFSHYGNKNFNGCYNLQGVYCELTTESIEHLNIF